MQLATDAELAFRLLVAAVCIATPTVLFVGLCRFLDSLRDDHLVDRVLDHLDEGPRSNPNGPAAALTGGQFVSEPASPTVACEQCGVQNPAFATYCSDCLQRLG